MKYNELKDRSELLSALMADIEDPSLLKESFDLKEEEVNDFLLETIHNFLWEEYKVTESKLDEMIKQLIEPE